MMDYKKALMLLLHETNHSGLTHQYINGEFKDFICESVEGVEFLLQNSMISGNNYIDLIKKRRELLGLEADNTNYSFEIQLCIDALNLKNSENLELEYKGLAKKSKNHFARKNVDYVENIENLMSTVNTQENIFDKNKEKFLELLNVIKDNRIDEKHSFDFTCSKTYIDWSIENNKLSLQHSFKEPELITDKEFVINAINMIPENYMYISHELKIDEDIFNLIVNKIKISQNNDNVTDVNAKGFIGAYVKNLLISRLETVLHNSDAINNNNIVSEKYKGKLASIGGYFKSMNDEQIELMLKVKEVQTTKFIEKLSSKKDIFIEMVDKYDFDYTNNVLATKMIFVANDTIQKGVTTQKSNEIKPELYKIFKQNKLCNKILKDLDDEDLKNYLTKKSSNMIIPHDYSRRFEELTAKIEYELIKMNVAQSKTKATKLKF